MYRESFLGPSATMNGFLARGRHSSFIEMEVSDLSNSTNFLSHGADSVFADIRVESKKSQLVVRLFKPKRRIRAGHGALER